MMKFGFLQGLAALVIVASMVSNAAAQPPTPGLQYVFDASVDNLNKAGGITDVSGNGHNGTVIDPAYAYFDMGPSGKMNAIHILDDGDIDPNDDTDGAGINTNAMTNDPTLNIFNGPYTCMAWVNLDDLTTNRDHMVFGTAPPNAPGATSANAGSLHLGFRGPEVYNGWWGAGTGRDSGYDNQSGGARGYVGQVGEWHHITWRFTGSSAPGYQDIFQDGVLSQSFLTSTYYGGILLGDGVVPNAPAPLLIGRNVANNGAFAGILSDVRIYNVALDNATIASIASSPP
jgi:hypothetical protein